MIVSARIKLFAGVIALSCAISTAGVAQKHLPPEGAYRDHPEWFQCSTNDQCVLTCEACGNVAINKEFKSYAGEVIPACLKNPGCIAGTTAQCSGGTCVAIYPDKELTCQRDDDCALVVSMCADKAVNKIYKSEYGNPSPSCSSNPLYNPNASVKCAVQKCVVISSEKSKQ